MSASAAANTRRPKNEIFYSGSRAPPRARSSPTVTASTSASSGSVPSAQNPVPLRTETCCCCATVLRVPSHVKSFKCGVCSTISDVRRSLGKDDDAATSSTPAITVEEVTRLRNRLKRQPDAGPEAAEAVHHLCERTKQTFSSAIALEGSFLSRTTSEKPRLSIKGIQAFYALVKSVPSASLALLDAISGILKRPWKDSSRINWVCCSSNPVYDPDIDTEVALDTTRSAHTAASVR